MLFYVKTPTDELVYSDTELSKRTLKQINDRQAAQDDLDRFMENHPNILTRRSPPPNLLAKLDALTAVLAAEVVTHVVLRGLKPDGTDRKIKCDLATYVAAWDQQSPFVTTILGALPTVGYVDYPGLDASGRPYTTRIRTGGIPFAGWPQTDIPPPAPGILTQQAADAAIAAQTANQEVAS